jgi:phosphoenolpyruvate carboxylase
MTSHAQKVTNVKNGGDKVRRFFDDYARTLETLFIERWEQQQGRSPRAIAIFKELETLRHEAVADVRTYNLLSTDESQPTFSLQDKRNNEDARYERYTRIFQEMDADPALRQEVLDARAKLQDIGAIARKQSTIKVLQAEHGNTGTSADDITYTLNYFKKQNVPFEVVQRYVDEVQARFSLTSHPTNPSSVAHTVKGIELETLLADRKATPQAIQTAMDAYIQAPVAAPRKSSAQELEELLPIMDNLFDAALTQRNAITKALQDSGYAAEGVAIRTPMLQVETWSSTFDGDGNTKATREALEAGVEKLEIWVRDKYSRVLDEIGNNDSTNAWQHNSDVKEIKNKLMNGAYPDNASLIKDLVSLKTGHNDPYDGTELDTSKIDDLIYLAQTFGLQGARGNLRHDAQTLQDALVLLAEKANINIPKKMVKTKKGQEEQVDKNALSDLLTAWMQEPEQATINLLKETAAKVSKEMRAKADTLSAKEDTSLRILERLFFLGERPEIANKLIIAEATHPADAKTAMALLQITGSDPRDAQKSPEIVLLVEEVPHVMALCNTVKTLAKDPVYQEHLLALGHITVMIAGSDNRRRDGLSAGEIITEKEGEIAKLQNDLYVLTKRDKDYEPLQKIAEDYTIPIFIFDGTGNDLMRGAAVNPAQAGKQQGYAASRADASTIQSPQSTIQGEATRLLFGDPNCAAMFLEMSVSQTMYAKAALEKFIPVPDRSMEYLRSQTSARQSAIDFHAAARKVFHAYTDSKNGKNTVFDDFFKENGAWVSTLLANRGSRSNQRGTEDVSEIKTIAEIRGERKPLGQRAISTNNLFHLTGTFHMGLLGQLEAFEAIGAEKAHEMFHHSLPDRTSLVGLAQQLGMTDFTKAWRIIGEERPSHEQVQTLANRFRTKRKNGEAIEAKETLAFLEDYGTKLSEAVIHAALGEAFEQFKQTLGRPIEMHDAFRVVMPDLSRVLDDRTASHEPMNAYVTYLENMFHNNPNMPIDTSLEMAIVAATSGVMYKDRPALGPIMWRSEKQGAPNITGAEELAGAEIYDIRDIVSGKIPTSTALGSSSLELEHIRLTVPANVTNAISHAGRNALCGRINATAAAGIA